MTDKSYTITDNYNIGRYPKAVYELYFDGMFKKKWVNSSRLEKSMIDEIVENHIPYSARNPRLYKIQNGEKILIWESKADLPYKVIDLLTDEKYINCRQASYATGIPINTISDQCKLGTRNKGINNVKNRPRFKYIKNV